MKRIVILLVIMLFALCSCTAKKEIKREIVDYRFTPAHSVVRTDYLYQYNVLKGDFVLVPSVNSYFVDDCYEVQYLITYDDGSTELKWVEVTLPEYEEISKR